MHRLWTLGGRRRSDAQIMDLGGWGSDAQILDFREEGK